MPWEVGITPHATACGQKEQIPCLLVVHAHVSRNETGLYSAVSDHTVTDNVSQFGFLTEIGQYIVPLGSVCSSDSLQQ